MITSKATEGKEFSGEEIAVPVERTQKVMSAPYPPNSQNPRPAETDDLANRVERMVLLETEVPFYKSLLGNLKEFFSPAKQGPMQVSFRPMSEQDLANSDDPELRRIAEMTGDGLGFAARVKQGLSDLFSPPKPIQTTSRPLTRQEMEEMGISAFDLEHANLPWYRTFFGDLKETLFPKKLPPLEVTSRPVQVKELFGKDEFKSRSQAISLAVHVCLVALAFTFGAKTIIEEVKKKEPVFVATDLLPYHPQAPVKQQTMGGGGGGGDRSPLPASKGRLPKQSLKQFTPPSAVVNNPNPKLVMEPTIIVPPDVNLPNVNMQAYGDPLAKLGPPSNGPGSGGGIGSGSGGGVGRGKGGGFGDGEGGGAGSGAFRIGGGVSAPVPILKVEPEYSEEARKAKFQGTVLLAIVVDEDGRTRNVRVVRSLGMGLDEKAIEAVTKWKFRPGYKNGQAVPVMAQVEVNFRLL